jgi:general nucleoside transport system permease protein
MVTFRMKKRTRPITSPIASLGLVLASTVAALSLCAILIALGGVNPLRAYGAMVSGAFGSASGVVDVIMRATTLLLTGLGTVVAFRTGLWNIGGEGQIYMGALGATLVGLTLGGLPPWLLVPLALLAGLVGGGLWALLPGLLKAHRQVSEIISTLMLSYVAILIIEYLVNGPLQGTSSYMPQTNLVAAGARLPLLLPPYRAHVGTILAIAVAVVILGLLWRSSFGYELRAAGFSPEAARYGGIKVVPNVVWVMVISGALSGLAGANEVLGFHHRLFVGLSPGYGFTGIIVALLGRLHPIGAAFSSILFSGLIVGANQMQSATGVPAAIAGIIQAVVILFVLGTELLLDYRPTVSLSLNRPTLSESEVHHA